MARVKVDTRTNWQKFKDFFLKTYDETEKFDEADIDKTVALTPLCYVSILFLIPLLVNRKSPFTRYHVNQGLVLFLFMVVFDIAITFLGWIFGLLSAWLLTVLIFSTVTLFSTALVVIGAYNAMCGKAKELPIIGRIRIIK